MDSSGEWCNFCLLANVRVFLARSKTVVNLYKQIQKTTNIKNRLHILIFVCKWGLSSEILFGFCEVCRVLYFCMSCQWFGQLTTILHFNNLKKVQIWICEHSVNYNDIRLLHKPQTSEFHHNTYNLILEWSQMLKVININK